MRNHNFLGIALAGFCAGAVTGLFGAGGGMVLVPLLGVWTNLDEAQVFPSSVAIILSVCVVNILCAWAAGTLELRSALAYLPGSAIGGFLAAKWGAKIPVKWLHRGLGILILWGGVRYLC